MEHIDWNCRVKPPLQLQYTCSIRIFSRFQVIEHLRKVVRVLNRQISFDSVVLYLAVRRDYS